MKKMILALAALALIGQTMLLPAQTANEPATNAAPAGYQAPPLLPAADPGGWTSAGIGQGFRGDAQELDLSVGAAEETRDIGGKVHHDLALSSLSYGHMLDDPLGAGHWYGGNFEFRQEVFGGAQYYRESRYLLGTTSIVRYSLATGTRWVPFLDFGVGGSLTNIKQPDLGSIAEFNGQIGPGVMYFWRDNLALTLQYRYMHTSNAGICPPNQGINENVASVGISWFF